MIAAIDAAHWWGPAGWFYRNCPGNLVAGFVQVGLAALAASLLWPPLRRRIHSFADTKLAVLHAHVHRSAEHNAWAAKEIARLAEAAGHQVMTHPHFGNHQALQSKTAVEHAAAVFDPLGRGSS